MGFATLAVDLAAVKSNWLALKALSGSGDTGAVVKADAYGLGADKVARALSDAGARAFFVALASEGAVLRNALDTRHEIFVFSGHMPGDKKLLKDNDLTPLLNSPQQLLRHMTDLSGHPFGIQLDSGMNRLGMEPDEFRAAGAKIMRAGPKLIISHLACADEPAHAQNAAQLATFREMTAGLSVPLSLSATGGILLGADYHFNLTRPGIGLYGGLPFEGAAPVVRLSIPVIQTRDVAVGETVGYGATWTATRPSRIATLSAGYADGLIRAMGPNAKLWADDIPCPLAGRVSMDLMGVDVTDLPEVPETLDMLGPHQTVDQLADAAGTIGYEILTSLGARYKRDYKEN